MDAIVRQLLTNDTDAKLTEARRMDRSMERIAKTTNRIIIAGTLVLMAVCTGCGTPMAYHFKHYHRPFAAVARSNKTYFHSQQTGRIIEKEPCASYCEPGCYGFEPTCWTQWPEQCPGACPTQDEILSEEMLPEGTVSTGPFGSGVVVVDDVGPIAPNVVYPSSPIVPPMIIEQDERPESQFDEIRVPSFPADVESTVPSPSDSTESKAPEHEVRTAETSTSSGDEETAKRRLADVASVKLPKPVIRSGLPFEAKVDTRVEVPVIPEDAAMPVVTLIPRESRTAIRNDATNQPQPNSSAQRLPVDPALQSSGPDSNAKFVAPLPKIASRADLSPTLADRLTRIAEIPTNPLTDGVSEDGVAASSSSIAPIPTTKLPADVRLSRAIKVGTAPTVVPAADSLVRSPLDSATATVSQSMAQARSSRARNAVPRPLSLRRSSGAEGDPPPRWPGEKPLTKQPLSGAKANVAAPKVAKSGLPGNVAKMPVAITPTGSVKGKPLSATPASSVRLLQRANATKPAGSNSGLVRPVNAEEPGDSSSVRMRFADPSGDSTLKFAGEKPKVSRISTVADDSGEVIRFR